MAKPTVIFDKTKVLEQMPAKMRRVVERMGPDQLRPIYLRVAKKLEPIVEGFFYQGATTSGGKPTAKWGRSTVKSLRDTVDTFPNKANKNKAYVVLGAHKMYTGANRGTPVHGLMLTGERARRGAGKQRKRMMRSFGNSALDKKLAMALSLKGMTRKYPHRPAYERASAVALSLYGQAFQETDAKVVQALRTEFVVT